jgi:hypothetical protein
MSGPRVAPSPLTVGGHIPTRMPQGQVGGLNQATTGRVMPRPLLLQPGPALALTHLEDRQINDLQQSAKQSTAQSRGNPTANGNLLEGVVLAAGANTIAHGLGSPIRGMLMGQMSAPATWSFSKGSTPSMNFVLTMSGAATVDLWVYS